MKKLILISFVLISQQLFAQTPREQSFNEFLDLFEKDPLLASQVIPPKFNMNGERITKPKKYFRLEDIQSKAFIKAKNNLRKKLTRRKSNGHYALADYQNDFTTFFDADTVLLKNLNDLNQADLNEFKLTNEPWSGDYWATYRGGIGVRYADPQAGYSSNFADNYKYFEKYWPLSSFDSKALNQLSPAEKYDLLVGDSDFTLTRAAWDEGYRYNQMEGKVPTWFGICDGWSGSSLVLPRPQYPVKLPILINGEQKEITFYPDDLKALASSLWAKGYYEHNFIGGRCDTENPKRDRESGRLTDPNCFDINPASYHLLLVNRLKKMDKGFVMDANFDAEVWNHPVVGYQITYFNLITRERSEDPNKVKINRADFKDDKFKKFRKSSVEWLVGVDLKVTYKTESNARQLNHDTVDYDNQNSVQYIYDLEINKNNEVVGGEWYQSAHPDFVWAPKENSRAVSNYEQMAIGSWNNSVPKNWLPYIKKSSSSLQPFAKIVDQLFEMSQQQPQ